LLEEAGLIRSRREGVRMIYEIVDPHIYNVIDAIDAEMTRLISEEITKKIGL